jgi:hypothetical protein
MTNEKFCILCNNKTHEIIEEEITFRNNFNEIITATATRYNDAFYEITKGKHKGALVHIWDIIKS